jgi:signal peptidase II
VPSPAIGEGPAGEVPAGTVGAAPGRHWRAVLLVAALVVADQAAKLLAVTFLDPDPEGTAVRLLKGAVYLKIYRNPGGVWGLLAGAGPTFFIMLSAVIAAWLSLFIFRLSPSDRPFARPFLLLLGGFIGNGIDRARLGYVIDFVSMTWYPRSLISTFNVADVAILAGLAWTFWLYAVRAIRSRRGAAPGEG